jgi:Bacteriophage tail sheath protein
MPTYLSPGIYTRETNFSFYVKQISTSSAAMVGVAEKGPINKPSLVTSWEQFINRFETYINEGYLTNAARAFFDNGGSVLYVNRIAPLTDPTDRDTLTAVKSSAVLPNREATIADTLRILAVNEGVWGDELSVSIEDGTLDPDNHFNLVVRFKGEVVEVFKDLSIDETMASHIELVINDRSDFITVEDLVAASGVATDRPAVGVYALSGGGNGLADLADVDYIGDPSQHTGFYAFDEIDALNLLMVPGVTTVPVINAGITYAESRKDLLFIADTPIHLEPLEAVDFRKGQGMYNHAAFNSSYAAPYYPWLEISDPVTSRNKLVPPCGAVAGCIARSDQKTSVWNAPAGIDRGRIFDALSVAYKTSRGERDVLYPEGINIIAVFPDSRR